MLKLVRETLGSIQCFGPFYSIALNEFNVQTWFGDSMRTRLSIAVLLVLPLIARANPVQIDGQSLIAFAIVAFWALVIESGLVTLTLVSCGVLIVPAFITLVLANVVVFLFAFLPLTGRVSLWFLEPGVVLADAVLVKLVGVIALSSGKRIYRRELAASPGGIASCQRCVILCRRARQWRSVDCA